MSPWRRPAAVGGCEPKDPQDPGNLQLDWLEVQLKTFRSRDMQVGERVYSTPIQLLTVDARSAGMD